MKALMRFEKIWTDLERFETIQKSFQKISKRNSKDFKQFQKISKTSKEFTKERLQMEKIVCVLPKDLN